MKEWLAFGRDRGPAQGYGQLAMGAVRTVPWISILTVLVAAAVGAWTIGFIAGLIVVWFGSR